MIQFSVLAPGVAQMRCSRCGAVATVSYAPDECLDESIVQHAPECNRET